MGVTKGKASRLPRYSGHGLVTKLAGFFAETSNDLLKVRHGLIAAGIAVAIIVAVQTLGTNLNTTFSLVSSSLK
jgi:pilus assembly protein Flp/PilA